MLRIYSMLFVLTSEKRVLSSFSIVVGSNLDRAHAFYTKMGSIPVKEVQVHKGADSVVYVKELS